MEAFHNNFSIGKTVLLFRFVVSKQLLGSRRHCRHPFCSLLIVWHQRSIGRSVDRRHCCPRKEQYRQQASRTIRQAGGQTGLGRCRQASKQAGTHTHTHTHKQASSLASNLHCMQTSTVTGCRVVSPFLTCKGTPPNPHHRIRCNLLVRAIACAIHSSNSCIQHCK
jgi:hypothetical protein